MDELANKAESVRSAFEKEKWDDEVRLRSRELDIKSAEAQASIRTQEQSRWTNPLVIAVLAAALAGVGNATVAWINDTSQLHLEQFKAESARILEVVKAANPDKAAENLSFLIHSGLLKDEHVRAAIEAYIKQRKGGEGVSLALSPSATAQDESSTTTLPSSPSTKTETKADEVISYQSGWIGGGHSQASSCEEGQAKLQPAHPGKRLVLLSSGESSRRMALGHVEYNYFCSFKVAPP